MVVGFRFAPTLYELINYYLKNKILGNTSLVNDAISEINICDYEPIFLPSLAKIQTDDPVWYYFCRKEYTNQKKKARKRTTGSGFWKPTGEDRKIKDKGGVEIGMNKTLVYYEGKAANGVRTPWIMHELHITCLPPHQRDYVLCKVMYNGGEDGGFSYGNNFSDPDHSLASTSNTVRAINTAPPEVEQLNQDDLVVDFQEYPYPSAGYNPDMFFNPGEVVGFSYGNNSRELSHPLAFHSNTAAHEEADGFFVDEMLIPMDEQVDPNTLLSDNINNTDVQEQSLGDDFIDRLLTISNSENVFPGLDPFLLENLSKHRPKKPLTGVFDDYSSDSDKDADSISAKSYQRTSSPDSYVGSSNSHFTSSINSDSCKDLQTSSAEQEVDESADKEESSMAKTEKKGGLLTDECKNPQYIYLMNMIIGFIFLMAIIYNFTLVFLSVNT